MTKENENTCLPLPRQHLGQSITEIVGEPILGIRLFDVDERMRKGRRWAPIVWNEVSECGDPSGLMKCCYHGIAEMCRIGLQKWNWDILPGLTERKQKGYTQCFCAMHVSKCRWIGNNRICSESHPRLIVRFVTGFPASVDHLYSRREN